MECKSCDTHVEYPLMPSVMGHVYGPSCHVCGRGNAIYIETGKAPKWCPKDMKNALSAILRKCQYEVLTPELIEKFESEILKIFSIKQEGKKI